MLDISAQFGSGWAPKDADTLERGPILVRKALQQSFNIPAIRALQRVGNGPVAEVAQKLGIRFGGGSEQFLQAGLAGAIGTVETRPIDLTAAFGSIANGGVHVPTRLILSITGPDGKKAYDAPSEQGNRRDLAPGGLPHDRHPRRQHGPDQNAWWSATLELKTGPRGKPPAGRGEDGHVEQAARSLDLRLPPAARSTGTRRRLAVGVWMGNSDHSDAADRRPATSLTAPAGQVWHSFMRDYTRKWPVAQFVPPKRRRPRRRSMHGRAARPGRGRVRRRSPGSSPARNPGLATGRPQRASLHGGLLGVGGQPRPGGAWPRQLGRRCCRLDGQSSARAGRCRAVWHQDSVLLGAFQLGRADLRVVSDHCGRRRRPSTGRHAASFMSHHRATRRTTPRRDTAPNRQLPRPHQNPRPRQNPRRRRHRSRPQSRNRRRHKVRRLINGTKVATQRTRRTLDGRVSRSGPASRLKRSSTPT